ncbi:MAG: hypothetical protein N3F09_03350, partial [Bacteroidia bacterium]|nr:hypothetical protein [Bacteroidia bacterium]
RDACSIFDQQVAFGKGILRRDEVAENLHMLDEMLMFEFSEFIAKNNISGCLHILDKIVKKGFDLHLFLTSLANHFRNILISTDPLTVPLIESSEEIKNQYANRASLFSSSLLLKILQLLSRADVNFKNSRNPRLFTESILIQLCSLTQSDEKKNELNEKKEIKIPEHSAKFIHTSTTEKTFPKFSNNPISKGKLELFKKNSKSITELIEIAKSSNGIAIELNVPAKTSSEAQDALLTKFTERNFTENEILLKLEDFIHNVAERNKYLSIALKNAQKKFENGYLFLNFLNETDKISFETERTNLYDFLTVMAEKKIYGIKVDVIKASPDNESKELNDPYKRFEQILIEYPWIAELKKNLQLNLEI